MQGYTVSVEPRLQTDVGLRKLDLVAKMGVTALVLDAQVVNDQIDLDGAHNRKVDYYKEIRDVIATKYDVQNIIFSSVTLSWRGLWSPKSVGDLTSLGVIKKGQIKILSTRAIIGGLSCFHMFNRATQMRGPAVERGGRVGGRMPLVA